MAETVTHTTICRFCHAYCGIEVDVADNHVLAVRGDRAHAVSQGFTCEKGRQLPNQHHDPHRLRATLRRTPDGSFATVPSETAMDEVAARLQDIIAEHGPRAVALYNGTKSWSNVSFALGLSWLNGIGSPSFYSTVTVDQPAKSMAGALHGYWQGGYHRIQQSDVVLFVGTNPLQSFLVEGIKLPCPNALVALRAEVQRGLEVIVIDPRRTETAQHAAIHLAVKPGEDPTLLAGMVRLIIAEELYDRAFVAEHGSRFEELRAAVEPFTLDYVERRAGVAADAVVAAARRFARGPRGAAVAGTGPNMAPHPLSTEMLVCALNTLCGRYGRAGDEVNHAGVLGAGYQPREGALPPREFWGYLEQPRVRGLRTLNWEQPSAALCDEILTPGDGQVRALICNGGNPAVAFPGQEKVVRALESLDLLVCLDVHLGPTSRLADYVFGCKLSLEKPDYTRHLEWYFPVPFAQYTPAIIDAEGDVIDEWELFWGLAHRMRVPLELGRAPLGPPVAHPRPVDIDTKPTTDELMEIEAADSRVPLAEVKRYPSGHVFEEARITIDPPNAAGARFDLAPELFLEDLARVAAEPLVDGGGYRAGERYTHRLASRRLRQVFNSTGTHLPALNRRGPGNPAYLGPDDMQAWGLADGDRVEISSEHGRIVGVAWTDPGVPQGVVSMAHAWGSLPGDDDGPPEAGACTNRLVANDVDFEPLIGQARQSAIPVNLRPLTLREEKLAMIDWEPHAEEFRLNPYPLYRQLRDEMPLYHNPERGFYALTRFDDCWNALVDAKRFSSADGVSLEKYEVGQKLMILMDPPRHTWHRKVMSRLFTPRVIANLEAGIRATCVHLLDDLRDREQFDVVEDFSMLLPMYVIAELLGMPDEYRLTAKRLSHLSAQRVSSNEAPDAAIAASLELNAYLFEETKNRRKNLGDDLISTIMTTPMIDDTGTEHFLDDEQIAAFFFEFTFAGNDTTTRSIANAVVGLSWYPDQRRELVADPTLIPNAVEELVRWDTPSHYLGRTTTEDVETPHGTIPAGSTVAVVLASANHDERLYEEPELLDIRRKFDRKLWYGIGPHVCIGAALARLELRVAFEEFLPRFPDFHVADSGCVQDQSGQNRGLFHLPLIVDRAAATATA